VEVRNRSAPIDDRPAAGAAGRLPTRSFATNPAASILPVVARAAPERVDDVFWRAVALMPKDSPARPGVLDFRAAFSAIYLARYDRQAATALSPRVDEVLRSPPGPGGHLLDFIWAKAAIDPRGAVAMIDAMPPGDANANHPTNRDRVELATWLAESAEAPWKSVWRYFRYGTRVSAHRFQQWKSAADLAISSFAIDAGWTQVMIPLEPMLTMVFAVRRRKSHGSPGSATTTGAGID
jgi:hypothetical protein